MNFARITIATVCALSAIGAYAADQSTMNAAQQAQVQQELTQLQSNISQLNAQIAQEKGAVHSSPKLGKLAYSYNRGRSRVESDANIGYIELMPATTFELNLLQAKSEQPMRTLAIGGYMEADAQYWQGSSGIQTGTTTVTQNGHDHTVPVYASGKGSQIGLTSLNIDTAANINEWTQALVGFELTNATTGENGTYNSKIDKAFVTVGNLQKTPFYLTVGKIYIPFGAFAGSGPWSAQLDRVYFRSDEMPQIIAGFFQDGLNASLSVFSTDSSNNNSHQIADFAYNMSYTQKFTNGWSYLVGASYLNNIKGTQSSLGEAYTTSSNYISSNGINPAVDVNGQLSYQIYELFGEYNQTLRNNSFGTQNLGKAKGWDIAVGANPKLMGKLTMFTVSYSGAAGIQNVPAGMNNAFLTGCTATYGMKRNWILGATRAIFPNWDLGLEYLRSTTYDNQGTNAYTLDSSLYF